MSSIVISSQELYNKKISKIKSDGLKNLHIISDFDKTLTKFMVNGSKVNTSFSQFREAGMVSESYTKESHALYEKYYPLEISNSISDFERSQFMVEWWTEHFDLLIREGVRSNHVDEIVRMNSIQLRRSTKDIFSWTVEHSIPFVIFSAGFGNIVSEVLSYKNLLDENTYIVSNFMEFNEFGMATSYSEDMIHVFNKNEGHLKNSDCFSEISSRKNVILVGDSQGDALMADGIDHDTVLKIGIFNEGDSSRLAMYEEVFDVVIKDTDDVDYVLNLLRDLSL